MFNKQAVKYFNAEINYNMSKEFFHQNNLSIPSTKKQMINLINKLDNTRKIFTKEKTSELLAYWINEGFIKT